MAEYPSMKAADLLDLCRQRGLNTSKTSKSTIISRLEENDRATAASRAANQTGEMEDALDDEAEAHVGASAISDDSHAPTPHALDSEPPPGTYIDTGNNSTDEVPRTPGRFDPGEAEYLSDRASQSSPPSSPPQTPGGPSLLTDAATHGPPVSLSSRPVSRDSALAAVPDAQPADINMPDVQERDPDDIPMADPEDDGLTPQATSRPSQEQSRLDFAKTLCLRELATLSGLGVGKSQTIAMNEEEVSKAFRSRMAGPALPWRLLDPKVAESAPLMAGYLGLSNTEQIRFLCSADSPVWTRALVHFYDACGMANARATIDPQAFHKEFDDKYAIARQTDFSRVYASSLVPNNSGPGLKLMGMAIKTVQTLLDHFPELVGFGDVPNQPSEHGLVGTWRKEDVHRMFELTRFVRYSVKKWHAAVEKCQLEGKKIPAHRNQPSCPPTLITDRQMAGYNADPQPADNIFPIGKNSSFSFETVVQNADEAIALQESHGAPMAEEETDLAAEDLSRFAAINILSQQSKFNEFAYAQRKPKLTDEYKADFHDQLVRVTRLVYPHNSAAGRRQRSDRVKRLKDFLGQEAIVEDATGEDKIEGRSRLKEFEGPKASVPVSNEQRSSLMSNNALLTKSSLVPDTFEASCARLGIKLPPIPHVPAGATEDQKWTLLHDYAHPVLWRLNDGTEFRAKPHQITAVDALQHLERSPLKGGILADEMGLGKTNTMLYFIYEQAMEGIRTGINPIDGSKKFTPTVIMVPASSLGPWKTDFRKFFSRYLSLHLWYRTTDEAHANDKGITLPSTAEGLQKWFDENCDEDDPHTATKIILTSVSTFAARTLKHIKPPKGKNIRSKTSTRPDDEDEIFPPHIEDLTELQDTEELVDVKDLELKLQPWLKRCIIDEGHLYKNEGTRANLSIQMATFQAVYILTGTPFSRSLRDMRGLLGFLWNPWLQQVHDQLDRNSGQFNFGADAYRGKRDEVEKLLKSLPFAERFSDRIYSHFAPLFNPESYATAVQGPPEMAAFRGSEVLPPIASLCMLRRGKGSQQQIGSHSLTIGHDIPTPNVQVTYLKMPAGQAERYRKVHISEVGRLRRGPKKIGNREIPGGFNTHSARRLAICASNAYLDVFSTDPSRVKRIFEACRNDVDAAVDAMEKATRIDKVQPPSESRSFDVKCQLVCSAKKQYVTEKLYDWIDALPEENNKVILFNDWPVIGVDTAALIASLGYPFLTIDASMDPATRESVIAQFNDLKHPSKVLIAGLRVAAQSLNIQAATKMLFLDVPASASQALQAFCRMWRYGVRKAGDIEILVCLDTIDMLILANMEKQYVPVIAASAGLAVSNLEADKDVSLLDDPSSSGMLSGRDDRKGAKIKEMATDFFQDIFGTRSSHANWLNDNTFAWQWDPVWCPDMDEGERSRLAKLNEERFLKDVAEAREYKTKLVEGVKEGIFKGMKLDTDQLNDMVAAGIVAKQCLLNGGIIKASNSSGDLTQPKKPKKKYSSSRVFTSSPLTPSTPVPRPKRRYSEDVLVDSADSSEAETARPLSKKPKTAHDHTRRFSNLSNEYNPSGAPGLDLSTLPVAKKPSAPLSKSQQIPASLQRKPKALDIFNGVPVNTKTRSMPIGSSKPAAGKNGSAAGPSTGRSDPTE